MSWGWPETVDIYLSQRLALVRVGGTPPLALSYSPTLPLAVVLERLTTAAFPGKSRRRFLITLSGGMAPACAYRVPREVTRWSEKLEVARAAAAQSLSIQPELIDCQIDSRGSGFAAAMSVQTSRQLHAWARSLGARIVSITPLWSIATQCRAATTPEIDAVLLLEPDGGSLMIRSIGQAPAIARTLAWNEVAAMRTEAIAIAQDVGVKEERLLSLGFGAAMNDINVAFPKPWVRHWCKT